MASSTAFCHCLLSQRSVFGSHILFVVSQQVFIIVCGLHFADGWFEGTNIYVKFCCRLGKTA